MLIFIQNSKGKKSPKVQKSPKEDTEETYKIVPVTMETSRKKQDDVTAESNRHKFLINVTHLSSS